MTETDLEREVRTLIREKIDKGKPAMPEWLTKEIVNRHAGISGEDKAWYEVCAYAHVRNVVRRCVGRYKESPNLEADEQLLLGDGWRHIQKAYLINRKGKQVIVRVDKMTPPEIDAKIDELRAMGAGCFEHADELGRYKKARRAIA